MSLPTRQVADYLSRIRQRIDLPSLARGVQLAGEEGAESPMAAEKRQQAETGIANVLADRELTDEQSAGIEAIILPKIRPVLDVIDGKFHTDHPLWLELNDEQGAVRRNLCAALTSIGRIELPGHPDYPYGGTGFVVGDGLVMTNRHVAAIFTTGVGTRHLAIKPGFRAGIDLLRELERPTGPTFEVRRVRMVHPYWDLALLEVDGLPATAKPLKLALEDYPADPMIKVAAIGYPAFDPRNNADVQNDLFRRIFGVKRLQPGTLGGRQSTASFGKLVPAVRHNCSTLGGNSGSALIDFATGAVVALHFGGKYEITNFGVPTFELARDERVIQAGVNFAVDPQAADVSWSDWWRSADESVITSAEPDDLQQSPGPAPASATGTLAPEDLRLRPMDDGSLHLVFPPRSNLRLQTVPNGVLIRMDRSAEQLADESIERLVMPWHDDNYETRKGYNKEFLGITVPLPKPADPGVVAKTKTGGQVLHYQNFSIVMHAARRMALLTASNVTAKASLKKPEAGFVYTRKGLSSLGKNDQEKWFADPRMSEDFQLPDVFYTRDDGAFDKGHLVRREDVAWGTSYETLRRANGDTYHVTNCSPQVAGFNRANKTDNWGDLENHVLKGAASERYCQFAGPVLDESDQVFLGAGGGRVRLRVKIPSRYWKAVVVKSETGLAAYGFVQEQDLSAVSFEEFVVPDNFVTLMERLTEIEKLAQIKFPDSVLEADQYDTTDGAELAFHAGARRRRVTGQAETEGMIV